MSLQDGLYDLHAQNVHRTSCEYHVHQVCADDPIHFLGLLQSIMLVVVCTSPNALLRIVNKSCIPKLLCRDDLHTKSCDGYRYHDKLFVRFTTRPHPRSARLGMITSASPGVFGPTAETGNLKQCLENATNQHAWASASQNPSE